MHQKKTWPDHHLAGHDVDHTDVCGFDKRCQGEKMIENKRDML